MPRSVLDLPWLPEPPADFTAQCRSVGTGGTSGTLLQALAGARLTMLQSATLARALRRCRTSGASLAPLSDFRLGILSNATFDLLADCIPAGAMRHGVAPDLVTAPYDQVIQQAMDPESDLNRAGLDAVLVAVDHRWLALDHPVAAEMAASQVEAAVQRLRSVVENLRALGSAPSILQTLPAPPVTLFGSFDRRVRGTVRGMVDAFNQQLVGLADETGSYLLDVATLAERAGTDRWFDPVQWAAYKLPFSAECFPAYADILGRLLGSIRGKARKCLVLDLDNTIWGGVIGDDGVGGIYIGQGNPKAEAFLGVQQAALELRERGIILAVCSKNDDHVARVPFREHPEMLLKEEHIAAFQANWIDKPSNLEAIAQALNIGLDALVFLDDNPAERAHVRAALPMVAVPELPDDPNWYVWSLQAAGYFEATAFSNEDRLRADSYAADAQRADVMAKARNLGDYLQSLEMVIQFAPFDDQGRQRITQLINKTNQFNLTTRRYTDQEVAGFMADGDAFTLQVRLKDRFGDLGMIGVVICRPDATDETAWLIDTWLMSCRVLGRQVERAMLDILVQEARKHGKRRLFGTYIPTSKNGMVADHFAKLGFSGIEGVAAPTTGWLLELSEYAAPDLPMRVESAFQARMEPPAIGDISRVAVAQV